MNRIIGVLGLFGLLQATSLYGASAVCADDPETRYWAGIVTHKISATETSVVTIRRVMEDSPAQRAGLRAGDKIVSVGELSVATHSELVSAVQAAKGENILVVVQRAATTWEFPLQPIPRPNDYRERVLRDRQNEAEDLERRHADARPRTEIPESLVELLALAAKQTNPSSDRQKNDDRPDIEVNPNRSTQLLLNKIAEALQQMTRDWNDLHERHQSLLQELSRQLEDQ